MRFIRIISYGRRRKSETARSAEGGRNAPFFNILRS